MTKNKQLFRQEPDIDFVNRIITCFNLKDINDTRQFCKYDLQSFKTTDKIKELIPEMTLYYVPCKSIAYLSEIDEKRAITILKHFILVFNYTLNRKEIIKKNKKIIYYNITSIETNKIQFFFERDKRTVSFD